MFVCLYVRWYYFKIMKVNLFFPTFFYTLQYSSKQTVVIRFLISSSLHMSLSIRSRPVEELLGLKQSSQIFNYSTVHVVIPCLMQTCEERQRRATDTIDREQPSPADCSR